MIPMGQSFSPMQAGPGSPMGRPAVTPIQQAIQTLSFRLPSQSSASAMAPQALLGQNPSAMGPGTQSASIQNWLKSLFGGQSQPGGMLPSPQMPQAPQAPWTPHTDAELSGGWGSPTSSTPPMPTNTFNPTFVPPPMQG